MGVTQVGRKKCGLENWLKVKSEIQSKMNSIFP